MCRASAVGVIRITGLRLSNPPEINSSCRIVADHVCAAAPVVLRSLMDTGKRQEAMEKKQMFLNEYRCPPGKLKESAP